MTLLGAACFLGACVASAVLVRVVRDFANRRALLDSPNERSSHSIPKPRLGGIGVVVPILVTGTAMVATGRTPPSLLVPLSAMGLISILGLADDLRPLPARVRFGVQVGLASLVVATSWGRLAVAAGPLGAWLPAPILAGLAVLWIVWLTNLYNFMDGIDGIAGVQALIAALGLAVVAARLGSETTLWLVLALAGSSLGFLLFNFPPSSIFMGDAGSTAIGFLFGIIPLLPETRNVSVGPVAMALSLFVLDATWTLLRRLARRESWYTAHRTHLYQRPVVAEIGHRTVLLVAGVGMLVVSACAAGWDSATPSGKRLLVVAPLVLFAVAHAIVRRVERRVG